MTTKITLKGKTYDLEDPSDLAKLQALLVPANWPATKKECLRLFQAQVHMLSAQLARHLAFNWKNLCKIAFEEAADGAKAAVPIAFAFEIDMSAPSVAAISGIKMSYSAKFSTKGKPQVLDLNQPELFDEGAPISLDEDAEPEAPPADAPAPDAPPDGDDGKVVPLPGAKKRGGKKSTKGGEEAKG